MNWIGNEKSTMKENSFTDLSPIAGSG